MVAYTLTESQQHALLQAARAARLKAYAPYSSPISFFLESGAMLGIPWVMTVCRTGFLVSTYMIKTLAVSYPSNDGMIFFNQFIFIKCHKLNGVYSPLWISRRFSPGYNQNSATSLLKGFIFDMTKVIT